MNPEEIEKLVVLSDAIKVHGDFLERVEAIQELALVEWFVTIQSDPSRDLNEQEMDRIRLMLQHGLVVPMVVPSLQGSYQVTKVYILTDQGKWWQQIIQGTTHPEPTEKPVTWSRMDWSSRQKLAQEIHPVGEANGFFINGRNRCGTCIYNSHGTCVYNWHYQPQANDYGCTQYAGPDTDIDTFGLILTLN